MNILIVPSIYPSNEDTQKGIFIHEQTKTLKSNGFNPIVVSCKSVNKITLNHNKIKKYYLADILIYEITYTAFAKTLIPKISMQIFKKNLSKLISKVDQLGFKPDVIYSHMSFEAGYASLELKKKYDVPLIVQEHFSYFLNLNEKKQVYRYYLNSVINGTDYFGVVSSFFKDNLCLNQINTDKVNILPNVINENYYFVKRKKKNNKFSFFSAGNLFPNKQMELLILSFIDEFKGDKNVELLIAGDGNERKKLENIILENKMSSQIKLLGKKNVEEMIELYTYCDAFALLSQYETFGLVFREAMMIGRPIITYKNGGIDEDYSDEVGICVNNLCIKDTRKALRDMYNNYNKYDLENISYKMKIKYSNKAFITKFSDIVEKCLYNA